MQDYIIPELQPYYDQLNKAILLETLCLLEYDYIPSLIINNIDLMTIRCWQHLSNNPAEWVCDILTEYSNKIWMYKLKQNPAKWANELFTSLKDKRYIEWGDIMFIIYGNGYLYNPPKPIQFILNDLTTINWTELSYNTGIFIKPDEFVLW